MVPFQMRAEDLLQATQRELTMPQNHKIRSKPFKTQLFNPLVCARAPDEFIFMRAQFIHPIKWVVFLLSSDKMYKKTMMIGAIPCS
jgi:predicted protein tyrosine phosphatase